MLTNDLSNNNTPSSAPPPPPPLPPADWGKNWKPAKNNDKNENTLGSTPSKTSNSTQLKRGLSEVSNPNLFEELKNNSKFKEANNANGETADKGSNIRQSEPNRGLTPKPVSPRVLSPQQDNGNSNKPSGTNNSTQSEKGLSENPIQLPTEQKSDTPILINTLVGISKTAALKYSIAILLLFTSGAVAGVCTYFMISAVSSGVAVPVLFAVIASVSALVMLSSAVYLINSHISAINSEKGVDPGRKQSQYSELQKEAESLGHSNTPTSSLPVMSRTTIVPPPPPPPPSSTTVKPNDLSTAQRVIRKSSPSDTNQKDVQQKQSNASIDNRRDLLAEIIQPRTLKKVSDEQKNYLSKDDLKIPQKQEEESTPGKQENGVQPLNNGVYQIRKVETQPLSAESRKVGYSAGSAVRS